MFAAAFGFLAAPRVHAEFGGLPGYVGSNNCKDCHGRIYEQWKLTPHARMLVNAKRDPTAVLANDFNPSIPFTKSDISYSVGSHYVQKYLTRIDGVLYVLPKFWNVPKRAWEPYSIFNWRQNPYNIFCDGCHTVGFDPDTQTFYEPGIGCESCHGPGREHMLSDGDPAKIVNPDKLDPDRKKMVCMACHTDGEDTRAERRKKKLGEKLKAGEIGQAEYDKGAKALEGLVKYPFAAEYIPGKDIGEYSSDFFMPKPKSKKWYWGTMDFFERKRMYYFFQSKFYSTSRACEVCGFDRGVTSGAERYMSRSESCGTCHQELFAKYAEHSGHDPEKTVCTDCHYPTLAPSKKTYSIHDHKFDFSQPKPGCGECHDPSDTGDAAVASAGPLGRVTWAPEPEHHDFHLMPVKSEKNLKTDEACLECHKGKTIDWARENIPLKVKRLAKN
jgi:hypothetical protein